MQVVLCILQRLFVLCIFVLHILRGFLFFVRLLSPAFVSFCPHLFTYCVEW
ncbi:hypothetical protein HMPREF1572_01178 [Gardnerella vaginalis JCP7275]|nr:hypothetical protein HMPREF1572_01178 [Gardnerella vaginalis JCP7275]